jgi:hypothetical protein
MSYIVQRQDRFFVVAYDGLDPLPAENADDGSPSAMTEGKVNSSPPDTTANATPPSQRRPVRSRSASTSSTCERPERRASGRQRRPRVPRQPQVLEVWQLATGRRADRVAYWDVATASCTLADMGHMVPVLHHQGRPHLDADARGQCRDAFLSAALERLDAEQSHLRFRVQA